jgi:AcrR family transcriptional regulator
MKRKPGRPPSTDRNTILDAAEPLFADRGFAGTSTRLVAARARCNVALISYHFGGKQGMYEELLTRHFQRLRDQYEKSLANLNLTDAALEKSWPEFPGKDTRAQRIRRFAQLMMDVAYLSSLHPKMSKVVWREVLSGGKNVINALSRTDQGVIPLIRKEMDQFKKDGLLSEDFDPRYGVLLFAGPIIWSNVAWPVLDHSLGFKTQDRAWVRRLVYHVLRGLFGGWSEVSTSKRR